MTEVREVIEMERGIHTCQSLNCKADARFKVVTITTDEHAGWFAGSSGTRTVEYLCRKHYIQEHGSEWA